VGVNRNVPAAGEFEGVSCVIEVPVGQDDGIRPRIFAESGGSRLNNGGCVSGNSRIDQNPSLAVAGKIHVGDGSSERRKVSGELAGSGHMPILQCRRLAPRCDPGELYLQVRWKA